MAKPLGRLKATLAVLVLLGGGVLFVFVTHWNPLPSWQHWLTKVTTRSLSTPAPLWSKRAGDQPDAAAVLPSGIVVDSEGSVEVHDPATGLTDWTRPDSWAAVAGDTQPVVVVGKPAGPGFDVYAVTTGVRLWGSNEKAGIWAYTNRILMLTCSSANACVLRSVDPDTGKASWSTALAGPGGSLIGLDRDLAVPRPVAKYYADQLKAMPVAAPAFIGLSMGTQVHVIATASGRPQNTFATDKSTRVAVVGHDVISSQATLRSQHCFYTVTGSNPDGRQLWQKTGIDLRTASGLGCEAGNQPYGGGNSLLGIDASGRDVVLSARSGKILFRAKVGEHVVALDSGLAVVRTAKRDAIRVIDLSTGHQAWQQPAPKATLIGVAPGFVLVSDPTGAGKLTAYSRGGGAALLAATSNATVLGIGTASVVINIGRTIGPLAVSAGP